MDIVKVLAEDPLYSEYEANSGTISDLLGFRSGIDRFCPECKRESVFLAVDPDYFDVNLGDINFEFELQHISIIPIKLICSRNPNHIACITFIQTNNKIIKAGIYPSRAHDLKHSLKKYASHFPDDFKDLNKAYGLHDHDTGIGSFTYLRRVFERRILHASERKKTKNNEWNPSVLERKRMEDKIEELRDELPEFLVKNREIYSILSKGIHELTEKECLKYFPALSKSIILLLDQEIAIIEEQKSEDALEKEINSIHSDLSS